jgi:hypothetical protein
MTTNDEFPLGEMVMIDSRDFEEMENDLAYWVAACSMLSEILTTNNIEYDVNEEAVAEFLIRKESEIK